MKPLSLVTRNSALKILCLGAHSDDIEIGCGGTILRWIAEHRGNVVVRWVVFSSRGAERRREAIKSAGVLLKNAKQKQITVAQFEDSFFPYQGREIKEYMHRLSEEFSPDVIFSHYGKDRHQDHRVVSELTWNAFRNHWILEYEIPKYDGDLGSPNVFVPLTDVTCQTKVDHLGKHFKSQSKRSWFTPDVFLGLQRLRGIECNAESGFAEAFYSRKLVL